MSCADVSSTSVAKIKAVEGEVSVFFFRGVRYHKDSREEIGAK